ncbi:DUF1993 domain-containing protein [Variovorax paradoxus]|uniref:DUF1993 domain-containing protein n=1 Tax=Variovorax paradoxus (strain S110) TaxID=543728 RepID=C5CJJ7_VARPS|nr:DUF1993 domain-containing protein [Variovorax paradoxus]MBW8714493.1 DUF1993 domain-containing protein [Variovorax paradoxus]
MALSMYDLSVPVFSRGLGQLTHLLEKSLAHARANDIDPATLVDARLAPDMLTLAGQIQRASDAAKLGVARIAGITAPSFPDEEKTYDDLLARIAKTQEFLATVERTLVDGQEERAVTIKTREGEAHFTAQRYLLQFALPNFFFHVTTAYDVLRHKGMPIGKMDYLGKL